MLLRTLLFVSQVTASLLPRAEHGEPWSLNDSEVAYVKLLVGEVVYDHPDIVTRNPESDNDFQLVVRDSAAKASVHDKCDSKHQELKETAKDLIKTAGTAFMGVGAVAACANMISHVINGPKPKQVANSGHRQRKGDSNRGRRQDPRYRDVSRGRHAASSGRSAHRTHSPSRKYSPNGPKGQSRPQYRQSHRRPQSVAPSRASTFRGKSLTRASTLRKAGGVLGKVGRTAGAAYFPAMLAMEGYDRYKGHKERKAFEQEEREAAERKDARRQARKTKSSKQEQRGRGRSRKDSPSPSSSRSSSVDSERSSSSEDGYSSDSSNASSASHRSDSSSASDSSHGSSDSGSSASSDAIRNSRYSYGSGPVPATGTSRENRYPRGKPPRRSNSDDSDRSYSSSDNGR